MRLTDLHARAHQNLRDANPAAVISKATELMRAGHSNSSVPEAIARGTDLGLPIAATERPGVYMRDPVDQWVISALKNYGRNLVLIDNSAAQLVRIQNAFLNVEQILPAAIPCTNSSCGQLLRDGQKSGECERCRTHRSRWRAPYPYRYADH